jgi:hypothetical protein
MVYNTWDYWVFGQCPPSDILKNIKRPQRFGNWTLRSSDEGVGHTYSVDL